MLTRHCGEGSNLNATILEIASSFVIAMTEVEEHTYIKIYVTYVSLKNYVVNYFTRRRNDGFRI